MDLQRLSDGSLTALWRLSDPRPFRAARFNKSEFQYRGVAGDRTQGYWWNEVREPLESR